MGKIWQYPLPYLSHLLCDHSHERKLIEELRRWAKQTRLKKYYGGEQEQIKEALASIDQRKAPVELKSMEARETKETAKGKALQLRARMGDEDMEDYIDELA